MSHWAADAVREFYQGIDVDGVIEALHGDELIDKYGIDDPNFPTDGFAGFELIVDDMSKIVDAAKSLGAIYKKDQLILPPSKFFGVMVVITAK